MNPEIPPNPRAELEARLTAYLLGELTAHEAAALRARLDDDAELSQLCDQLRPTIDLVRQAAKSPTADTNAQSTPLKLSDERREKLLAHFKTVAPKEFTKPPKERSPVTLIIEAAAVMAILGVLAGMLLPALSKAKSKAVRINVYSNLKQIELAKQMWADENHKSAGDAPTVEDLKPYLNGGLPRAVGGESYSLGKLGEPASAEVDATEARKMYGNQASSMPLVETGRRLIRLPGETQMAEANQATFSQGFGLGNSRPRLTATTSPGQKNEPPASGNDFEANGTISMDRGRLLSSSDVRKAVPGLILPPTPLPPTVANTTIVLPATLNQADSGADFARRSDPISPDTSVQSQSAESAREAGLDLKLISPNANRGLSENNLTTDNWNFYTANTNPNVGALGLAGTELRGNNTSAQGVPASGPASSRNYGSFQLAGSKTDAPKADGFNLNVTDLAWQNGQKTAAASDENSMMSFQNNLTSAPKVELKDITDQNSDAIPKAEIGSVVMNNGDISGGVATFGDGHSAGGGGSGGRGASKPYQAKVIPTALPPVAAPTPLVVGGTLAVASDKTPTLGDLPMVGSLFTTKNGILSDQEETKLSKDASAAGKPSATPNGVHEAEQQVSESLATVDTSWKAGADPSLKPTLFSQVNVPPLKPASQLISGINFSIENSGKLTDATSGNKTSNAVELANLDPDQVQKTLQERFKKVVHDPSAQSSGTPMLYDRAKSMPQYQNQSSPNAGGGFGGGFGVSKPAAAADAKDYAGATQPGQPTITLNNDGRGLVVMADDTTWAPISNVVTSLDKPKELPAIKAGETTPGIAFNTGSTRDDMSRMRALRAPDSSTNKSIHGDIILGPVTADSIQLTDVTKLVAPAQQPASLSFDLNGGIVATNAPIPIQYANGNADISKSLAYLDKKKELEQLQKSRDVLALRTFQESVDVKMPKTTMVETIDRAEAEPEQKPSLLGRISESLGGKVERKARIKIEPDVTDVVGVDGLRSRGAAYDPGFAQTQTEAIQSEVVLDKVINELDLNNTWAKKRGEAAALPTEKTRELLRKSLDLKTVRNTSLLDIGVKSDSPEEAAKIANAVADVYHNYRTQQREELTLGGITAFKKDLSEQDKKIARAETELAQLANDSEVTGQPGLGDPIHYNLLKIDAQTQLAKEEEQLNRIKRAPGELKDTLYYETHDAVLAELIKQHDEVEGQRNSFGAIGGRPTPEMQKVLDKAASLDAEIDTRTKAIMVGMETRVASLKAVVKASENATNDVAIKKPAPTALEPQPEVLTSDNAFSTFSLNVADVSFKLAAASLEKGVMPDPGSIRSEEFINAFDYRDPAPAPGAPLAFAWGRAQYPFAQNRDLVRFAIKTAAEGREAGRPMNLVLLLDNSGSMERADRVEIIHEALRVLAAQLKPQDTLSVVTFARTARLWVDGVSGDKAGAVAEQVSGLTPEGGTNLEEAMRVAYDTALRHYLANGVNRVVLLTDGAANLGNVDPDALKQKVETNRKQGIALDCFGIGWEGYNDDLLETLSRNGDGRYGFINTPEEAATGFAGQLAGALHVAAADVKAQIEFNPKRVTSWRQIGYAKHQLTKEQFRDNTVDAAEIGAAEEGNALYTVETNPNGEGPIGTVRVRFRVPGTQDFREHEWALPYNGAAQSLEQSATAMRLAATASAFSEWLGASPFAAEVTPDALLKYLRGVPEVYGADARPQKLEWMIRQAKSLEGK